MEMNEGVIYVDLKVLKETFENILIDVFIKNENLLSFLKTEQQDYFIIDQLGHKLYDDYKVRKKLKSVVMHYYYRT